LEMIWSFSQKTHKTPTEDISDEPFQQTCRIQNQHTVRIGGTCLQFQHLGGIASLP
jgi:hypothetical protein